MNYIAINFEEFSMLPSKAKDLLRSFFGSADDAAASTSWIELARNHNDQAAAFLAVLQALSRTTVELSGGVTANAREMLTSIRMLAGDRLYVFVDRIVFLEWKDAGGRFSIARASGGPETGRVRFNRGAIGGSLHAGFDIQGFTSTSEIPRIQWNYRNCDSFADIDLDGFSPFNIVDHFQFKNSDPRQWFERYVSKFGNPGFEVREVGNVPELRVDHNSFCASPSLRITDAEQEQANAMAELFIQRLESDGDFRSLANDIFVSDFAERCLKDPSNSPLNTLIEPELMAEASADDLIRFYTASTTFLYLGTLNDLNVGLAGFNSKEEIHPESQASKYIAVLTGYAASGDARDNNTLIKSVEQLEQSQARLEQATAALIDSTGFLPGSERTRSLIRKPAGDTRAWLSVSEEHAFGFPPGTRFIDVELPTHQLLLAPADGGMKILFAVPRSK